jgi:hypothetical protein
MLQIDLLRIGRGCFTLYPQEHAPRLDQRPAPEGRAEDPVIPLVEHGGTSGDVLGGCHQLLRQPHQHLSA